MSFDFNPHSDPVARDLHAANANLRDVGDQLWELNQPAGVRAALQAERAEKARALTWGVRVVLGLALAWVLVAKMFGAGGARVFGGLLSFAWNAAEILLVVGFFVWIGQGLWRGVRWLAGGAGQRP